MSGISGRQEVTRKPKEGRMHFLSRETFRENHRIPPSKVSE